MKRPQKTPPHLVPPDHNELLNYTILEWAPVLSGRINACYVVSLKKRRQEEEERNGVHEEEEEKEEYCFLKMNRAIKDKDFSWEVKQLEHLSRFVDVPKVLDYSPTFLILERLSLKPKHEEQDYAELSKSLSRLHLSTVSSECGYDFGTYHSTRIMSNACSTSWLDFFRSTRFRPRLDELADRCDQLSHWILGAKVMDLLPFILDDTKTTVCLLHGDVNDGNWGVVERANPAHANAKKVYLFDPNLFYGDHLFDIASLTCFAKVPECFFDGYELPIREHPQWQTRQKVYHYYILLTGYLLNGNTSLIRRANNLANSLISDIGSSTFPSLIPTSHLRPWPLPCAQEINPAVSTKHGDGDGDENEGKDTNEDRRTRAKPCVTVFGGTFSPIHINHLKTLEAANRHLEEKHGYCVLGSYLSPTSDSNAGHKLGKRQYFRLSDRVKMIRMALQNENHCAIELTLLERYKSLSIIEHRLLDHYRTTIDREEENNACPKVEVILVCGSDKLPYVQLLKDELSHKVLIVERSSAQAQGKEKEEEEEEALHKHAASDQERILFLEHKEEPVSSTLVRSLLGDQGKRSRRKLEKMLHPDVLSFLVSRQTPKNEREQSPAAAAEEAAG